MQWLRRIIRVTKEKSIAWHLGCAIFIPIVLLSIYLLFSRWPIRIFSEMADYIALGISTLLGAVFVAMLPIRKVVCTVCVLLYVFLAGILLFYYSFAFVGVIFGDWL
jgi:hypothetical protein